MLIQYISYWRWGDKSVSFYDLNDPGSRTDLRNLVQQIKEGKAAKEITQHEFYEVKRISIDSILPRLTGENV